MDAARIQSLIQEYNAARSEKEWAGAYNALDEAIEIAGTAGPVEWKRWKVEIAMAAGDWDLAARSALLVNQKSHDGFTIYGLVLFLSAQLPEAQDQVQYALKLVPNHPPARALLRRINLVHRLKEEGNTAFKAQDYELAILKYTAALGEVGEDENEGKGGIMRAILLSNRATALLKVEKHEQGIADCNESLLLSPSSFKALRTRARLRRALELYEASIEDYAAAAETAENEGEKRVVLEEGNETIQLLRRSLWKDYYGILEVLPECSDAEIRRAYKSMVLTHHPDRGGNEEEFKLINEAHTVLSDPIRRARYDAGEIENGQYNPEEDATAHGSDVDHTFTVPEEDPIPTPSSSRTNDNPFVDSEYPEDPPPSYIDDRDDEGPSQTPPTDSKNPFRRTGPPTPPPTSPRPSGSDAGPSSSRRASQKKSTPTPRPAPTPAADHKPQPRTNPFRPPPPPQPEPRPNVNPDPNPNANRRVPRADARPRPRPNPSPNPNPRPRVVPQPPRPPPAPMPYYQPQPMFVNQPPPGALRVLPGDPRIGGVQCRRCHGTGLDSFLVIFEETCSACNGIGRVF
ncbi:DnaJ-domain-containing protein [Sistotremastrum niveocremeum HHB9708]|uniref:DnaJ-domain-containing protein n=1 Tax=Sistotremastrum niveocremeum HHB9708 TaxID=1314777 RepID=A0A164WA59_9AGAM|nr:DnaJ-domain-containing protein [Sistotremastrum niveocremeum HHB9708]